MVPDTNLISLTLHGTLYPLSDSNSPKSTNVSGFKPLIIPPKLFFLEIPKMPDSIIRFSTILMMCYIKSLHLNLRQSWDDLKQQMPLQSLLCIT